MKQVTATIDIKIDNELWEKFIRRLLQFSRRDFASLKITTDSSSLVIQQVSPVPRRQRTIISFGKCINHVAIEKVTMESAKGIHLSTAAELAEDVRHFIESFLEEK